MKIIISLSLIFTFFIILGNLSSAYAFDLKDLFTLINKYPPTPPKFICPQSFCGFSGIQEIPGTTGFTGPQGLSGEFGYTGPTGPSGEKGPHGEIGFTGFSGEKGMTGEIGSTGFTGPQGIQGNSGTNGISGWEIITGQWSADNELQRTVTADCTSGKKVIGGGFEAGEVSYSNEVVIKSSYPSDDDTWTVMGNIDSGGAADDDYSFSLRAYAICANIQ